MADTPRLIKVSYNNNEKVIAVYTGLVVNELQTLLQTIFSLSSSKHRIVAVQSVDGVIIPLSLVCQNPDIVPATTCNLVVSTIESSSGSSRLARTNTSKTISSSAYNETVGDDDTVNDDDDDVTVNDDVAVDDVEDVQRDNVYLSVMNEISRFIYGIRNRNIITVKQARLLENLLSDNSSTILHAAYSVAISADDAEYFAQICKELSLVLEAPHGRSTCDAQDEVLQICDQLYKNNRVTENQLLYLRHLVLIRDESVAVIYDTYQDNNSVQQMARSLHHLANQPPSLPNAPTTPAINSGNGSNSNHYMVNSSTKSIGGGKSTTASDELLRTVASMLSSNLITGEEAGILKMSIEQDNVFLVASYELFLQDQNLSDLHDTLKRFADREKKMKSRLTSPQQQQPSSGTSTSISSTSAIGASRDTTITTTTATTTTAAAADGTNNDANIDVDALLKGVGVNNVWSETVPKRLIIVIFASVHKGYISVVDASMLCDLYEGGYAIVTRIWERYSEHSSITQLLQELVQLTQELHTDNVDEDDDTDDDNSDDGNDSEDIDEGAAAAVHPDSSSSYMNAEHHEFIHNAKHELLKFSLEIMKRQKLMSTISADSLLTRFDDGDADINAAIDNYSKHNSMEHFFQTLVDLVTPLPHPAPPLHSTTSSEARKHSPVNSTLPPRPPSRDGSQSQVRSSKRSSLLSIDDQRSVIKILEDTGRLNGRQIMELYRCVDDGDDSICDIFLQYESDSDVTALIDSLKALVATSDDDDANDDAIDDASDDASDDDAEHTNLIENLFTQIVNTMDLSGIETAALRLAIARGDRSIKEALVMFRQTFDETALKKTLLEISKATIKETLDENTKYTDDDASDDASDADAVSGADADDDEDDDGASNDDDDASDDDASDDDASDDDASDDDRVNSNASVSKSNAARNQVFPILVGELLKEGFITKSNSTKLLALFASHDAAINNVLDIYDRTDNMPALIDGLLSLSSQ